MGAGLVGLGVLAGTGQGLPFQPPTIPLDRIVPGLSAAITYQGPLATPTEVGLSLTYKEQGSKVEPGPTATERYRKETARMAADQASFRAGLRYPPGSPQALEQRAIERFVLSRSALPGLGLPLIPLRPGAAYTQ